MYRIKIKIAAFFLLLFLLHKTTVSAQQKLFKMLSAKETGVNFTNEINESEDLNVLAYEYFYNGGGVAVGDINNDGLLDIFFTSNMISRHINSIPYFL